jgi:hypothetical protein
VESDESLELVNRMLAQYDSPEGAPSQFQRLVPVEPEALTLADQLINWGETVYSLHSCKAGCEQWRMLPNVDVPAIFWRSRQQVT